MSGAWDVSAAATISAMDPPLRSGAATPRQHRVLHLADPAAEGTRLDRSPQHLVASRERAAVRHREPESVEEPHPTTARVVLERGPRVVDHVVVQELHVSGLEAHRDGQLLGERHEEVDGLALL